MPYLRKRGDNWFFTITDSDGRKVQRKGCSNREVTLQMARSAEADAAKIREGLIDPADQTRIKHERNSILDHIDAWRDDMSARGVADPHPALVHGRVARIVDLAGIKRISDISPSRVQAAVQAIRDTGVSLRTIHHYISNAKQFSRWLLRDGRAKTDPLAFMTKPNPDTDRRHERRALTADELARLFAATRGGKMAGGLAPLDREALYRIAAGTGFRLSELRSLTPESFDLDAEPPTVTIEAGYSKRRRRDVQPIRRDLAETIRGWLDGKPPRLPMFDVCRPEKSAAMLRVDLEAAGIDYRDASGRVVDFHALRHSYISALARSSAPVKIVQSLARHSNVNLTMSVYAHVALYDQTSALEALPAAEPPSIDDAEANRPTGTDGKPPRR